MLNYPFKIKDEVLRDLLKAYFPTGPVHTSLDQLKHKEYPEEELVRVANTKVLHANYKLLQHDFPQLNDQTLAKNFPSRFPQQKETLINEWLLDHTSFVSKPQAQQSVVNTPIQSTEETTIGYRPKFYGRAIIYSLAENRKVLENASEISSDENTGLLDVKGAGITPGKKPTFETHGNGLLMLEDAFIEYVNQQLIQGIFFHAQTTYDTLPIYAIIDLGFKVKHSQRSDSPACLLIRRAHTRPSNSGGLPKYGSQQQRLQLDIELLLRKYGMTSINKDTTIKLWKRNGKLQLIYGKSRMRNLTDDQLKNLEEVSGIKDQQMVFEGVNVQHTGEYVHDSNEKSCQLVDFGSYHYQSAFSNPILSLTSDKLMRWGGSIFPGSERYVQPDPRIALPEAYWGKSTEALGFPTEFQTIKQHIVCRGLSRAYMGGELSKELVMEYLDAYIQTATILWKDEVLKRLKQQPIL